MALWRHEVRRCGKAVLAAPPVVVVLAALLSLMARGGLRDWLAGWFPGALLPMAAGIAAVSVVSREAMAELQLTLPTPYPVTVRRRLAVLAVVVAVAGLAVLAVLTQGSRPALPDVAGLVAATAAFSLALIGVGTRVAAGTTATGGGPAATAVVSVWLAKTLMMDRVPVPQTAVSVAFAAAGVWLLVRGSRKAGGEVA